MVNLAAIAGALLDLFAYWGQGVTFGAGAAIGVLCAIEVIRLVGWEP